MCKFYPKAFAIVNKKSFSSIFKKALYCREIFSANTRFSIQELPNTRFVVDEFYYEGEWEL